MSDHSHTATIAVAQFAPGTDKEVNLISVRDLATDAASMGAKMVVFPEYSSYFAPQFDAEVLAEAEAVDGPFVRALGALAKVLGIHLVAGMLESAEGDRVSNTVVALDPRGELVATYRKLHLYDAFGHKESDWVRPGDIETPETFRLGDFTVGIQTCYDLRFPEQSRRLVDAGADIVVVPSEWVRGPLKEHHWRTLVTARALENTIYVVAADHAPPVGAGNSMIVDPMGVELATIGEITDVAVARASSARLAQVREINPALALRRFTISEPL